MKISLAFPLGWASVRDESFLLRFGFAMKMAGVEWSQESDLILAIQWLTKVGIAESVAPPSQHSHGQFWMIRRATTHAA